MSNKPLMSTENVARDFVLLDLYRKDIIYYFTPSTVFLSAIAAATFLNLILNDKVKVKNNTIEVIDLTSTRTYNKLMIDYLIRNDIKDVKSVANEVFLDNDFSTELYELLIKELYEEGLIDIETKSQFILTKNIVRLTDQDCVREAYLKLFETLYNNDRSQHEIIALALVIDTFFSVDDYFDEEDHIKIKENIEKLKENESEMYQNIIVFKDVIDEFYNVIAQRSTNYFGI